MGQPMFLELNNHPDPRFSTSEGWWASPCFLELNNHSAPSFAANVCKRGTMGQPLFFGARQSLSSIFCSKSVEVKGGGPAPVCWSSTISLTHYLQQKSAGEGSWASPCFLERKNHCDPSFTADVCKAGLFVRHTCKNVPETTQGWESCLSFRARFSRIQFRWESSSGVNTSAPNGINKRHSEHKVDQKIAPFQSIRQELLDLHRTPSNFELML